MLLAAGSRLGPYEILEPIGAGGMGEVYKARDTRLDRLVAIKVSTRQMTDRFAQEARAVAALNHPNIVALYDVGENYIVTELVEGEPLRNLRLAPRRAIEVAAQVADGLAAAHAGGIAHRDLKPDNVMVTRDGRAKILDFGLSRQYDGAGAVLEATRTMPGTVMGTVGYMSPEQVRGQEADHRSDIFSFGVMLYEMLAPRSAFTAGTAAEIMTAILNEDPPGLPPSIPAPWREIVRHCMEKEPDARFQSAKDLSFALRSLLREPSASGAVPAVHAKPARRWIPIASAIAATIAAFALGWIVNRKDAPGLEHYRFTPIASEAAPERNPQWSPDGKSIVYAANVGRYSQIFTRRLDSPVPDQITHENANCGAPFWSRKGDRIFFGKEGKLWSVAVIGGAPQKVLDDVTVADIAPDGVTMAVATYRALAFGKLGGAEFRPYTKPPFDRDFGGRLLQFSPDGKQLAVLFAVANYGVGEIWLVPNPPDSGEPRKLFAAEGPSTTFFGLSWMPDSRHLVVALNRSEGPQQLYLGDSVTGALRQLTVGMISTGYPAVSPDGKRIACEQQANDRDLIEIDLDGKAVRPILSTARIETGGAWLSKGREFIYGSDANGPFDLWVRNAEDGRARSLLIKANNVLPGGTLDEISVAPDGERIALTLWAAEHTIWALRPSGGKAVRIDPGNPDQHSPHWSPDGNWIAYARVRPKPQLMKAPAGGGPPEVIATLDWEGGPTQTAWSPTGEWIAWAANTLTLYSPDGKQQRKLGTNAPRQYVEFSRDGKTLYSYYFERREFQWVLDAIDVASGNSKRVGVLAISPSVIVRGFAMHPDGKRFLAAMEKSNPDIALLEGF